MKLTFLGTGAGETYPGYWCECPHCTYARKHRGKNLRTNSSMVIDEELLFFSVFLHRFILISR